MLRDNNHFYMSHIGSHIDNRLLCKIRYIYSFRIRNFYKPWLVIFILYIKEKSQL